MKTTTYSTPERRAAAEHAATHPVRTASFERMVTTVRVIELVVSTALFGGAWYIERLASQTSTGIESGFVEALALVAMGLFLAIWANAVISTVIYVLRSDGFSTGHPLVDAWLSRHFVTQDELLAQQRTEMDIVATATSILDIAARITAPDALATWGRLSALDAGVEALAQTGRNIHTMSCTPSLSPAVRCYALDAFSAYESVLTPSTICAAAERFTDAHRALSAWRIDPEVGPGMWGFVEMHLRLHCRSNLDWAMYNEFYVTGSTTFDTHEEPDELVPEATAKRQRFLTWWNAEQASRAENLPFDLVLLHAPCSLFTSYGWQLEEETRDYPLSLAPRSPAASNQVPIEYVTKLWRTATQRTLHQVVSAARKITR